MKNQLTKIIRLGKNSYKAIKKRISDVYFAKIKVTQNYGEKIIYVPGIQYKSTFDNYHYSGKKPYWFTLNDIALKPLWIAKCNGTIIGRGILSKENKEVILESTLGQIEYLKALGSNHLIHYQNYLPSQNSVNKAISLSNRLEHNYYHWILEGIGRLIFLPENLIHKYCIVINVRSQKFVVDSLVHFIGVNPSKLIFKKEISKIDVKELLIPSFPVTRNSSTKMTNIYHPEIIKKINERSLLKSKIGSKKNIIISRKNAIERRMVNINLIKESFPNLNFEIVYLEHLSFKEQLNLFANSSIVVAVHGAGLVNMVFAKSPLIIEFFPSNRNKRDSFYFYQLSQVLRFEHYLIEYDPVNSKQDFQIEDMHLKRLNKILK